jgi:regulator of protease activity HflC (stomatin/prohibitin superfamily)
MKYKHNVEAFVILFLIFFGVGLFIIIQGFDYVPAGHTGVTDTFGKVGDISWGPGVEWTGVFTSTKQFSTRIERKDFKATAASKDLQVVTTEVSLNYRLDPSFAPKIYKELGTQFEETIMYPIVQESIKGVTAQFTAEELITKRQLVKTSITEHIVEKIQAKGLIVTEVALTEFDFSDEFNKAIEAKQTAEQDALKALNEKRRAITQAEAQNEKVKLEADAEAYSVKTKADSEAYALRVVREELAQSKDLVQYKAVEKWSGNLPTFYTMGNEQSMLFNIPVTE